MADKIFTNVRLGLKVDTLENWGKSTLPLKKGEVAFATVAATAGTGITEPVVMMKIGEDGVKTFKDIEWNFYAKASDVLTACKSETALKTFINGVIADAGIASNAAMEELAGKVTTAEGKITTLEGTVGNADGGLVKDVATNAAAITALEGLVGDTKVATQITEAIAGLDLANTYAAKTHTHTKSEITDFAHTHEIADVTGLQTALDGKQAVGDYATKTEAKGYADAKDEAITAAQTAANKAQGEVDALETYVGTIPTDEKYANITNVVAYVNKKAEETLASAQGGSSETAASVKAALDTYKSENDPKVAANTEAIDALEEKVGDTKVSDQISTAVAAEAEIARAAEKVNAEAITKLNANAETEGSVDYKIAQKFATLVENPDEAMNSIQELVDWTTEHAADALEMSNQVTANKNAIATLNGDAETDGSVAKQVAVGVTEAKDYTDTKVEELADGAVKTNTEDIAALEKLVGDTAVATQIADAIDGALMVGEGDAKTEKYALATDLAATNTEVGKKANDADLAAVAKSGLIDDISIGEGTTLVFDCGTSAI